MTQPHMSFVQPRVRVIDHFACTGGTLFARLISLMPDVTLVGEHDPLSPLDKGPDSGRMPFRPTDLLFSAKTAYRPASRDALAAAGRAGIVALAAALRQQGQVLCVRGHVHSQYCTSVAPADRLPLARLLQDHAEVAHVVTVRHPLASFLSLERQGWLTFAPQTPEAYATRYLEFLDDHPASPVFRYEDLLTTPDDVLSRLCAALDLPFEPGRADQLSAVRLSGDSGRSGDALGPRPPLPLPKERRAEVAESEAFHRLCARLGYDLWGAYDGGDASGADAPAPRDPADLP